MKYPWLAASIVLIWAMAAFAILVRDEIRPDYVLGVTIVASLILGVWGFRAPR